MIETACNIIFAAIRTDNSLYVGDDCPKLVTYCLLQAEEFNLSQISLCAQLYLVHTDNEVETDRPTASMKRSNLSPFCVIMMTYGLYFMVRCSSCLITFCTED